MRDWRRQFQKLESVNLRYDNQVIVNPDMEGKPRQAAISPSVAKAAIAAGVKTCVVEHQDWAARKADSETGIRDVRQEARSETGDEKAAGQDQDEKDSSEAGESGRQEGCRETFGPASEDECSRAASREEAFSFSRGEYDSEAESGNREATGRRIQLMNLENS